GVLIVSLAPADDLVERFHVTQCPVVLIDAEYGGLSSVTVEHEASATLAVRHLLELGHRRIALIDRPEDPFTATYSGGRHAGYRQVLAAAGLPVRPEYEALTKFTPEAGIAALYTMLELPQPPTAIFVGSDSQAIGVIQGARQRGCRVPEDLSVVGYNDVEVSQYLGLTTVRVPMCKMGRRGVELLLARLDEPEQAPVQERLQATLVVRTTTGPPAVEE
ncbi:MAG: substrate-binding domain-containing protein, partial [Chloroflexota bacterium]